MQPARWLRRVIVGGTVVVTLLAGAGRAGGAGLAGPACGDVLTTSVVLTSDLSCSGSGLIVQAPNVTVDLNGHTLFGSGVGRGVDVRNSVGATVENGAIRGFDVGVASLFSSDRVLGYQLTVRHLRIAGNGTGIATYALGQGGISGTVTIDGNVIVHNRGAGIDVGAETDNVHVVGNRISSNGGDGVTAWYSDDGGLYQDNRVSGNGGYGISVQNSTSRIIGNTVIGNGADGIRVFEAQEALFFRYLVSHNSADLNGGHGIVQNAGMPDPRSNSAKNNATEPQCLNITCSAG